MATRQNSSFPKGMPARGSRPRGNGATIPGGAKVGGPSITGGVNTFSGRVPGAMKGIVGGTGNVTSNDRPFKSKAGPKGSGRSRA